MKFVFLHPGHHKNTDAIIRMCKKTNIELEFTTDFNRCKIPNYDILISNQHFFNPDLIPESIKIIFGPQLFILPSGPIVGPLNPKWGTRCVDNTLSTWVETCYLDVAKSMVIQSGQFPFAVDTELFKPTEQTKQFDCLIYFKSRTPSLLDDIKKILNEKKITYKIVVYGSYKETDYINLLHDCKFMLTIGRHESQGFALEEAMASGVPLLVFDCKDVYDEIGTSYFHRFRPLALKATSVPYWDSRCGLKTVEMSEVSGLVDEMMKTYETFKPRDYILETLSEEVCIKRILDYFILKI
jgi:hypothetical protein